MSCQIRLTANIQDISTIRKCLFPTDDQRGSDSWLQLCEISASPTADIIAIGNERKIVVLSSKWDSQSSLSQFVITYSGSIHEYDKVKAILCLPVIGQTHNTHLGPEWTCIVIGYDSGYVRFYTETCDLLMEEQFHCENITSIKCQSQHSPRPDISPDLRPEEIYIQYQSNVCILSGVQLFAHLRNCREQLAKVQGKGEVLDLHINLRPKKWGYQDQAVIHDTAVVGLNLSSTFDHLLTASTCGGFDTKYRAVPPNSTLVLAVGCKPFLGYHYALEGGSQPVFSDVAKVVASKLKSALPGWLTGNKTQVEKQTMSVAMQPAEAMGCRFGLCDLRRTATDIILSPDRKLAAVSDALGRVLLIDSFKGITLRIFKGYRDAQCSFIQVPDERKSKHRIGNKVAHFLVIYSSKKGTLEVFSVQQGTKITTFTASKFSRLLYVPYGLMGFMSTSKSRYVCQFTTIFIDNDGNVKEILIPFHFALEEKNSKRARDIHLYKKLRQLIKSGDFDEEKLLNEVLNTCAELKTVEMKSQMVDMLLNNKDIPAVVTLQCVEYFISNLVEDDSNNLKIICENASLLLKFYIFVTSLSNSEKLDSENGNLAKIENTTLNLEAKELKNLQKLLDLSTINDNKLNAVHVSFSENSIFSVADFLSTFDYTKANSINLKHDIDENILFKTAEVIFKPYIIGESMNYKNLQEEVVKSKITLKNVFELLVNYWVNRSLYINLNLEKEMNNLSSTIYSLGKVANKDMMTTEYSAVSKFWSEIRDILANSSRPFPALMAAILCKQVAQNIDSEIQMDESSASLEDENIEVLTQENIEWSLLIGKLEDVSLLNIILSSKPNIKDSSLPKLQHEKSNISLKYILLKGKGSISESVAQWLTLGGINPQTIVVNEGIYKRNYEGESNTCVEDKCVYPGELTDELLSKEPVLKYLNLLRIQFPYSLEASTLLANMTWEYALAWQKDIQDLGNLEAAIKCTTYIENIQIKQGLYQLLWNTHLKIINESVCKLINKVGKLPKERLCRQATGLSDYQISLFVNISTDFLDSFMDVAQLSFNAPKLVLNYENIWENGGQPLVALAAQQKEVNYDLLHLHYQLSLVLQMITTFSVKHSKPVNNLFEASVVNLLFTDLQKKVQISWNKSDININASRTQFLCKIISASLESVTVNHEGKIYSMEHVNWMSKCVTLARFWNLEVDKFKRFQVVQLFANGFDSLAEELVPAVNELNELGLQLMIVAAKRLSQFLSSSPDLSENISALSPYLTKYMDSLDDEWCAPSSLAGITNLATHTLRCLDDNQTEYKLAQLLLEACSTLEEIQS